jgi:predicted Zn-dependent protease
MKKLLLILSLFLLTSSACLAYDVDLTKEGQYQKKVMETGFNILNANRIEKRVVFDYKKSKSVNAYAVYNDHSVTVLSAIVPYMEDEAELAGIISHEIAHNMDYYDGIFNGYFKMFAMRLTPKKYEKKADKLAVDYMVKAGYNPVAMIVALNKICGQQNWWGIFSKIYATHPLASDRLAYIYEYIYNKYPAYLVDNEYKENVYYQNFLLTSRTAREKIRRNHEINVSNTSRIK